jgi:CubicO group peptidase (beta-lactamase class C family)
LTQGLQQLAAALDDMFEASNATGGTAVLVYNDSVVFQHNFGYTTADGSVPVTGNTSFRLASNTKVFTDVMLFHLRDAGKVSLDDQVGGSLSVPERDHGRRCQCQWALGSLGCPRAAALGYPGQYQRLPSSCTIIIE